MLNFIQIVDLMIENFVVAGAEAVPFGSVAEPPLFWEAPAPDGQGLGADSGSDLLGSAPALCKKRRLQAAPAPYTKVCKVCFGPHLPF